MITEKGNILIVDDNPDNLRLLSAILSEQGYKVRKALNGQTAIKTVQTALADLILLDITMPGMNGYEVCQNLKADEKTAEIPIIFISALNDVLDKVKAFNLGGMDYITKPFQSAEVLARVENQLIICRQKRQLQQEIQERQKAEEALRVYLHAVSHDLRNPVIGMSTLLNTLLKRHVNDSTLSIPVSVLTQMANSCDRQLNLINSLVETQQFEIWGVPLECQPLNLWELTDKLVTEWQPRLIEQQAIINNQISPNLPLVNADAHQLWRVFENLVANALKHNPAGIDIVFHAQVLTQPEENHKIYCSVADNGVGMTQEVAQGLFEPYYRGIQTQRITGLGLGLYLCRQIINAHGGEIGVITSPGNGATFWFTLAQIGMQDGE